MNTAYFDSAGGLVPVNSENVNNNTLIKNALILVEGAHTDNKGRLHEFPAVRIQRLVDNTNSAIATGVEIPLMADHSKELLTGGELKKLGEVSSNLECRIISPGDLPNPKMTHLIGKLGAFGKIAIRSRVEDVRNGLIKLLSPGIDLAKDRIAEVSAVAFPAIHGPALFKANYGSANFSLSYADAKEIQGAITKIKQEAQDCFDILFSVLRDIDAIDPMEMMGVNPATLKRKAVEDFVSDLLKILRIQDEVEEEQGVNAPLPYAPLPAQYSQSQTLKTRKRR